MNVRGIVKGLVPITLLGVVSVCVLAVVGTLRVNTQLAMRGSILGARHSLVFTVQRGLAREYIEWHRYRWQINERTIDRHPPAVPPAWSFLSTVSLDRIEEVPLFGAEVAVGWPFVCFVGEVRRTSVYGHTSIGPRGVLVIGKLEIPYRPLLPGLLINLIVHTATWWCVIHVVGNLLRRIVRHRRKDKGLCMSCGYDVYDQPSGSKCPECGEARW